MAEAGVRDLRNRLSQYLERVKAGEELIVTDRGQAIARLVPLTHPRPFDRLVAEGIIQPATATPRRRPEERVNTSATVSDLVADQRR